MLGVSYTKTPQSSQWGLQEEEGETVQSPQEAWKAV